jgi:hypothetical protein
MELLLLKGIAYSMGESLKKIDDSRIINTLFDLFFIKNGDTVIHHGNLLRDTTLCGKCLSSYLLTSQEVALQKVFGQNNVGIISEATLRVFVHQTIQKLLLNSADASSWWMLILIQGDLPPHEDIYVDLKRLILSLDLEKLIKEDEAAGKNAMVLTVRQLQNFPDPEIISNITEQCIKVCIYFSSRFKVTEGICPQESNEFNDAMEVIVGAAQYIAMAKNLENIWEEFSAILNRMVDSWPAIAVNLIPMVRKLCLTLPVAHTKGFWELRVKLRAMV